MVIIPVPADILIPSPATSDRTPVLENVVPLNPNPLPAEYVVFVLVTELVITPVELLFQYQLII